MASSAMPNWRAARARSGSRGRYSVWLSGWYCTADRGSFSSETRIMACTYQAEGRRWEAKAPGGTFRHGHALGARSGSQVAHRFPAGTPGMREDLWREASGRRAHGPGNCTGVIGVISLANGATEKTNAILMAC